MVRKSNPKEITVKTETDTYVLKVPTGALGWKHFRLLMSVENARKDCITEKRTNPETGELEDYMLPNPKLDEVMDLAMNSWIETILPELLISHEFDEIAWTELMLLFNAICTNSSVDTTKFRDSE